MQSFVRLGRNVLVIVLGKIVHRGDVAAVLVFEHCRGQPKRPDNLPNDLLLAIAEQFLQALLAHLSKRHFHRGFRHARD